MQMEVEELSWIVLGVMLDGTSCEIFMCEMGLASRDPRE